MGTLNKLIRSMKQAFSDLFGVFSRKKRGTRTSRKSEPVKVPGSWKKKQKKPSNSQKTVIIQDRKVRIPGLRTFHKILASVMLLINLIFSQFLLGSVGAQAQPMFLLFVLNSYLIFRLLWSYRSREDSDE